MRQKIRLFILFEAVTFVVAALIHAGVLVTGIRKPVLRKV